MGLLQVLNLKPLPKHQGGSASAGKAAASPSAAADRLHRAADAWRDTHRQASERIAALKKAIQGHYADGHPELLKEIDGAITKLDDVMDNVDHRLADALARAGHAKDDAARKAEIAAAKKILTDYATYIKGEPLVAHMDHNPFGVKTELRVLLGSGLTVAAKAMG